MKTNDATRAKGEAVAETPVTVAPIPYPLNQPIDEMDEAIAKLRTVRLALMADAHRMAHYSSADAEMMIETVLDQLDPIRTYLAENHFENEEMSFLECRRNFLEQEGDAS